MNVIGRYLCVCRSREKLVYMCVYAFVHTAPSVLPSMFRSLVLLQLATGVATSAVVRLRGLPFYANETHIVEFFHGFSMAAILPATAPVDGRPSGEAYVEFSSVEEAWRALKTRQGAIMDRRYIELFPATKHEMDLAAAGIDPRGGYGIIRGFGFGCVEISACAVTRIIVVSIYLASSHIA